MEMHNRCDVWNDGVSDNLFTVRDGMLQEESTAEVAEGKKRRQQQPPFHPAHYKVMDCKKSALLSCVTKAPVTKHISIPKRNVPCLRFAS